MGKADLDWALRSYRHYTEVSVAAARVAAAYKELDRTALRLSPLGKRELQRTPSAPPPKHTDVHILLHALGGLAGSAAEAVLLDFGGGQGGLTLLAKAAGVGTVIYYDVDDDMLNDARTLGTALGLGADHYVGGSLDALVSFMSGRSLSCDCLVSYDVLEHVYDLEDLFSKVPLLSPAGRMVVVMGTGANEHNPRIARHERRKHLTTESQPTQKLWGRGKRDTVRPYRDIRADMIRGYAPELAEEEVAALALATRGLTRPRIRTAVEEFRRLGRITVKPDHPTNTCCPETGYWCERLLRAPYLQRQLLPYGFSAEVVCGYYDGARAGWRGSAGDLLNLAIKVLGSRALAMAPYMVLSATRSAGA